jgi:Borrelia membrane protein P13
MHVAAALRLAATLIVVVTLSRAVPAAAEAPASAPATSSQPGGAAPARAPSAPPTYAYPPYPYGAYPYGAYPYGSYPYAAPYVPSAQALYAQQKRTAWVGVGLELLFPGLGSVYGDHLPGAFVSWGSYAVGLGLLIGGAEREFTTNESTGEITNTHSGDGLIIAGIIVLVGSRIYGFYDAWTSVERYNAAIAQRLGVHDIDLTLAPLTTARALAWGPALSLRF